MHDPTEGGLATGLSELAGASGCGVEVHMESIPVIDLAKKILSVFSIDPLGALASGSLIVCCKPEKAGAILTAWKEVGILGALIGTMTSSPALILTQDGKPEELPEFKADEITKAFKPGFRN